MDPYLEATALWPDVHLNLTRNSGSPQFQPSPALCGAGGIRVYISDDDDPGRTVLVPDVRVEVSPRRRGRRSGRQNPCLSSQSH